MIEGSIFAMPPDFQRASLSRFHAVLPSLPQLFVQYLYSTDYGVTSASHTLMFRYTFRKE